MIGRHVNNYDSRVLAELYDMEENYTDDISFRCTGIGRAIHSAVTTRGEFSGQ